MNAQTRAKPRLLFIVVLCAALSSSAAAQTKLLTWLGERVGVRTAKDQKQAELNKKWQKEHFADKESQKNFVLAVRRSKCNICHVYGAKKDVRDDFGKRLSKRIHTHLEMDATEITEALKDSTPEEVRHKVQETFYRSLDEVLKEHVDVHDEESETIGERWKRGDLKATFRLL
jgi:hypothetical protein